MKTQQAVTAAKPEAPEQQQSRRIPAAFCVSEAFKKTSGDSRLIARPACWTLRIRFAKRRRPDGISGLVPGA
jgi:hypothetical protein